ncbi:MAG TPA: radical SAM protein [candidate division WOR-3 bacterium]|uniref:Radical SAM protein n=1 Tax=candidate division WOR-3 bacterium TaxID=2052148 RepID=A0A9C9EN70_UNCW3|nr:radical SAM protein [candidate division WOR-3 bacterium]
MKISLIFPPHWDIESPYPSLPCLTAFLRKKGHKVFQYDLNIELFNYLLTTEFLEKAVEHIHSRYKELSSAKFLDLTTARLLAKMEEIIVCGKYVAKDIEDAKGILRVLPDRNKLKEYIIKVDWAWRCINRGFNIITVAFLYPSYVGKDYYLFNPAVETLGQVINVYKRFPGEITSFLRARVEQIIATNPQIIGISIVSIVQLTFALLLSEFIRERNKNIFIVFGGPFLSLFAKECFKLKSLLNYIDGIIFYEGEQALDDLCDSLSGCKSWYNCRNLFWKKNKSYVCNKPFYYEDPNFLPPPDYDGLPLKLYLSPRLVIGLPVAIGCYWNKCTFCSYNNNYFGPYREKSPSKIAADMSYLAQKYDTNLFHLISSCISPRWADLLANKITDQGFLWTGMFRFEKSLSRNILKKLKSSGLYQIQFGLESASPRILKLMCKGIDLNAARNILRRCKELGIFVHIYVINNFPTETTYDFMQTLNFLKQQKRNITSFFITEFVLALNSPIWKDPSKFGLAEEVQQYFMKNKADIILFPGIEIKHRRDITTQLLADFASQLEDSFKSFNHYRYYYRMPTFHGASIYMLMALTTIKGNFQTNIDTGTKKQINIAKFSFCKWKEGLIFHTFTYPEREIKRNGLPDMSMVVRPTSPNKTEDFTKWYKIYIFDPKTEKLIRLAGELNTILTDLGSWINVDNLIDKFAKEMNTSKTIAKKLVYKFLNLLYTKGLIFIKQINGAKI